MKTTLSLLAVALLAFSSSAQTNAAPVDPVSPFTIAETNAPAYTNILGQQFGMVFDFFAQTGSNWSVVPFITFLDDEKYEEIGGGIAAVYSISDYAGAMLRVDYLNGDVFMPSGNFQLQLPITLGGKFQVVPFLITGIATPLNAGEDTGDPVGIIGSGLGVRVSKKIGVVYDVEKWSSFDGFQHRFGVLFRF